MAIAGVLEWEACAVSRDGIAMSGMRCMACLVESARAIESRLACVGCCVRVF